MICSLGSVVEDDEDQDGNNLIQQVEQVINQHYDMEDEKNRTDQYPDHSEDDDSNDNGDDDDDEDGDGNDDDDDDDDNDGDDDDMHGVMLVFMYEYPRNELIMLDGSIRVS